MLVDPKDLTYLSQFDLFKIIISSADRFPGLYRISSSWEQSLADRKFMKLIDFMEALFHSEKGRQWTKKEWLQTHDDIFKSAFGKNSRNDQREENDIKETLKEKNYNWYSRPNSFRLLTIDTLLPTLELLEGQSYYMMGSIIRFDSNKVRIAYDYYADQSYLDLDISFSESKKYIDQTFSKQAFGELFLHAEVVGHLGFKDDLGSLLCTKNKFESLFETFLPTSHIFASVIYPQKLPIEYAKPIGVSNVTKLFA